MFDSKLIRFILLISMQVGVQPYRPESRFDLSKKISHRVHSIFLIFSGSCFPLILYTSAVKSKLCSMWNIVTWWKLFLGDSLIEKLNHMSLLAESSLRLLENYYHAYTHPKQIDALFAILSNPETV